MDKIYLLITSGGSYEDRWKNIDKAFYSKEKAEKVKEEYDEFLRKAKNIEKQLEKRGKMFDYETLYETYDAEIKEVEIE